MSPIDVCASEVSSAAGTMRELTSCKAAPDLRSSSKEQLYCTNTELAPVPPLDQPLPRRTSPMTSRNSWYRHSVIFDGPSSQFQWEHPIVRKATRSRSMISMYDSTEQELSISPPIDLEFTLADENVNCQPTNVARPERLSSVVHNVTSSNSNPRNSPTKFLYMPALRDTTPKLYTLNGIIFFETSTNHKPDFMETLSLQNSNNASPTSPLNMPSPQNNNIAASLVDPELISMSAKTVFSSQTTLNTNCRTSLYFV